MLVIGTFEHSLELEQMLGILEHEGVSRMHMLIVPMDTDPENPFQYSGKSRDIIYKSMEVGMACATVCSVIGTCVGFILALGPVFWGLLAAFCGFAIGFGTYFIVKKGTFKNLHQKMPEVTVIVQCTDENSKRVTDTMWKYGVLSVGKSLHGDCNKPNDKNEEGDC